MYKFLRVLNKCNFSCYEVFVPPSTFDPPILSFLSAVSLLVAAASTTAIPRAAAPSSTDVASSPHIGQTIRISRRGRQFVIRNDLPSRIEPGVMVSKCATLFLTQPVDLTAIFFWYVLPAISGQLIQGSFRQQGVVGLWHELCSSANR